MFDGLLQPTHVILILAVALIVLGPKRLPELGRSLGSSMRGFREAIAGRDDETPEVAAATAPAVVAVSAPAVAPATPAAPVVIAATEPVVPPAPAE